MFNLRQELGKITARWRLTAQQTRLVSEEIPNLLARGHMNGVSDGLEVAAEDIDGALAKDVPPPGR